MAPRKKESRPGKQPDLAAPPVAPPAVFELPRLLRYTAPQDKGLSAEFKEPEAWQVERFDMLAAKFVIAALSRDAATKAMESFHGFAREHPRQWQVARRLFGLSPMIPSADAHPDDLRLWTRDELIAEGFQVDAELEALLVMWRGHLDAKERARQVETVSTRVTETHGQDAHATTELELDDKILEEFLFSERIFKITVWDPTAGGEVLADGQKKAGTGAEVPRSDDENRLERNWFVRRAIGWQKMLRDPMGGPVARSALMNDLYLRRLESEIAVASGNRRQQLMDSQQRLATEYNRAAEKLQEMFPDLAVAGRVTFHATTSDWIIGHRDYYAFGDRRLLDKAFTASEIAYQLRTSLQQPAQYRLGLALAMVEARQGMFDPEFRSQLRPVDLKKLDAIAREAAEYVRQSQNEPMVDLERGVLPGEGDEFPDFNDEECPDCGRWRPHGNKCSNQLCKSNKTVNAESAKNAKET